MDTNRRQVESNGNQNEPNIKSSKQLDSESSKDDLALGLLTPDKTPEPNYRAPLSLPIDIRESLSPPAKSLNTSVKKKPHYITVPTKEAELKKNIDGDIGEQNVVIRKRIKK